MSKPKSVICLSIRFSMWHSISIDGVSLVQALRCWEGSQETTNRPGHAEPSPYSWPSANIDSSDLELLSNANSASGSNRIRHQSGKLDRAERRRLRSKFCYYFTSMAFYYPPLYPYGLLLSTTLPLWPSTVHHMVYIYLCSLIYCHSTPAPGSPLLFYAPSLGPACLR